MLSLLDIAVFFGGIVVGICIGVPCGFAYAKKHCDDRKKTQASTQVCVFFIESGNIHHNPFVIALDNRHPVPTPHPSNGKQIV